MTFTSVKQIFLHVALFAALLACPSVSSAQQQSVDTERLGMALEYFQTGKYHEALMLFQQLDKRYKLNPRFRAYIGLCYFHEWDYKKAVAYFDKELPKLQGLSPHELSVYYYAAAESYFQMQNYDKALPYYELDLEVCYEREKGDLYYRTGLCHMFRKEWHQAYDSYTLAEKYYHEYRNTADLEARLAQIANMKNGCLPGIADEIDDERAILLNQSFAGDTSSGDISPWNEIIVPEPWIAPDGNRE